MGLGSKTLKIVPKSHATMEHLTKIPLLPTLSKHDFPTENGLHICLGCPLKRNYLVNTKYDL